MKKNEFCMFNYYKSKIVSFASKFIVEVDYW